MPTARSPDRSAGHPPARANNCQTCVAARHTVSKRLVGQLLQWTNTTIRRRRRREHKLKQGVMQDSHQDTAEFTIAPTSPLIETADWTLVATRQCRKK